MLTVASAAAGDLYLADGGSGNVFKFAPDGAKTTYTAVDHPRGLAFDDTGNLFVADNSANTVFKISPGGTQTVFASNIGGPWGLAFDKSRNLYISENFTGAILKFSPDGSRSTFATGTGNPRGIAFDPSGNLFVADVNGFIYRITPDGGKSTFASGLSFPAQLSCDTAGNIYEADSQSGHIYKFSPDGGKNAAASNLGICFGFAFDDADNLFVTDRVSNTVTRIAPDGSRSTFASGLDLPYFLVYQRAVSTATPSRLLNISTRMDVQSGSNVLIGGFIVSGTSPKHVLVRALGPSLGNAGIANVLADPVLDLHDGSGSIIVGNDNWKDTQRTDIEATGIPPSNDSESAIVTTINAGNYTAVVSGKNGGTGVGLVEVYDLDQNTAYRLANISTRGLVETGTSVMIAGFIVGGGGGNSDVLVRGLGPSLAQSGITNAVADPTLELHDGNGATMQSNDNWKDTQQAAIQATGIPPSSDMESAIVATLPAGKYTAVLAGKNGGTGVALVEVYHLQ